MISKLPLLIALVAAFCYAASAILVKIGLSRGLGTWAVVFFGNMLMGLAFLPFLFFGHDSWNPAGLPVAVGAGLLFFAGQVGTFRSLASGDVSIATPALASKVVFVALLSAALTGKNPDPDLWLAVGLTMAGVVLLHQGPRTHASHPLRTLGWALFAALVYAGADVLMQTDARRTGVTLFLPVMFATVALVSFPLLLPRVLTSPPPRPGAWRWASGGLVLLAAQAVGVAAAIGLSGDATSVNVVYSSRGLWSLLLLLLVARHLGVAETALGRRTFLLRLAGSLLVLGAVALVLL